jgi:hypothetical protein
MTLSPATKVEVALSELTVDAAMKIAAKPSQPTATSATSTASSSAGSAGSAGSTGNSSTQTPKYAGLKLTQTFDQKIQDLQKLIVAKGGDAAAAITAKGGAIGKYGSGTAKAIGILAGTNKEENEITADIDAKLQAALAGVTVPATVATATKAGSGTATKPAAKPATKPKVVAKADPF